MRVQERTLAEGIRSVNWSDTGGQLSARQRETLLLPLNPRRVLKVQGQSHLPAFDVRAYLNRVFGFEGFDREILSVWLIAEDAIEKNGRTGFTVTYGAQVRLTIRNPDGRLVKISDGVATGSALNQPSRGEAHDLAMKSAESYALKRAAIDLGDCFGLALYNGGKTDPVVRASIAYTEHVDDAPPTPQSLGNDERADPAELQGLASANMSLVDKMMEPR